MKKLILIILRLVMVGSLALADCKIYIGEYEGDFTVGLESKVKYGSTSLTLDFGLIGVEEEDRNDFWWKPVKSRYAFDFTLWNFRWEHFCIHAIDDYKGEPHVEDKLSLTYNYKW